MYEYTEKEALDYATEVSKTVTIRSYENGNSSDIDRESTPEEAKLVRAVIGGALFTIRFGGDVQAAKDTAEYILLLMADKKDYYSTRINVYDTVYIPIGNFLRRYENAK